MLGTESAPAVSQHMFAAEMRADKPRSNGSAPYQQRFPATTLRPAKLTGVNKLPVISGKKKISQDQTCQGTVRYSPWSKANRDSHNATILSL